MPLPSRPVVGLRRVVPVAVLAALAVACSSNPMDSPPPTIEPASAAVSPPTSTTPAGVVRPLAGAPLGAIVDSGTAALAVLSPGPNATVTMFETVPGTERTPGRIIGLPVPATALTNGGSEDASRIYLSTRGGYLVLDPASGVTSRVEVRDQTDTDFTAIARRDDGRVVLGSADGAVFILAPADGSNVPVEHHTKIFARVDSIVAQGNTVAVIDRGQTSVTTIDAEGNAQQALRAGEGATTMAADSAGRVLVTDTRGNELLVFSVDPLIMRQRYPVPSAPYGVAGSPGLVWVSQTAANTVIGYDLATGIPVEKVRYPTVQQPNLVSFDAKTDTLYVVSGTGAGVQVISHATGTR